MRPVFADPRLQADYERDGYVVVPLLDREQVARLADRWEQIRPASVSGIYSNVQDAQPEVNRAVHELIVELFTPAVDRLFLDCRIAGGTFLVKGTGPESHCTLHQDHDNVDERSGSSFSVWCPLVDVDAHNGALQVLAGTHDHFDVVRAITLPSLRLDVDDEVGPLVTTVPARAGEAVVYAHDLFHGSGPNHSDRDRVVATCGVIPNELDHVHHWRDPAVPDGPVHRLAIDAGFYYTGLQQLWSGALPDSVVDLGPVDVDPGPLPRAAVLARARTPTAGGDPGAGAGSRRS